MEGNRLDRTGSILAVLCQIIKVAVCIAFKPPEPEENIENIFLSNRVLSWEYSQNFINGDNLLKNVMDIVVLQSHNKFSSSNLSFTETKHSACQWSCSLRLVCMSEIAILPSHCALYYLPGQICPTTSDTNILGFHCAFSIAVSRWTTSLSPAERSEMDNGFRRTQGVGGSLLYPASYFQASSTWGKKPFTQFSFSLIYLWRANRSCMRFSAMSCFTLTLLHAFGSCSGNCVLAWLPAGSCCPVKPQFATASHWAAPVEQLEVVQGHFNSSCYRTGGSLVL